MTSAVTGATVAHRMPPNTPNRLYTTRPPKNLPAKTQMKRAARPAVSVPRAATLILPKRSLARPTKGRPRAWDTR